MRRGCRGGSKKKGKHCPLISILGIGVLPLLPLPAQSMAATACARSVVWLELRCAVDGRMEGGRGKWRENMAKIMAGRVISC